MDNNEFWRIIDYSFVQSSGNQELQKEFIIDELLKYNQEQIIDFKIILDKNILDLDDFKILAALQIIEGWGVSDDGYLYFRCWLIAKGQLIVEKVLENPDFLTDIIDESTNIDFEELMYLADNAYEIITGKTEYDETFPTSISHSKGLNVNFNTSGTKGKYWNLTDLPILYPKLCSKFNRKFLDN